MKSVNELKKLNSTTKVLPFNLTSMEDHYWLEIDSETKIPTGKVCLAPFGVLDKPKDGFWILVQKKEQAKCVRFLCEKLASKVCHECSNDFCDEHSRDHSCY